MDIDLARHSLRAAFRVSRELQELMQLLKEHCDKTEYAAYARDIASAIDSINVAIANRVVAEHPELNDELELKLSKYDQFI